MENVKLLISKKVISLEGENVGYVLNVVFDGAFKNFLGLAVVDNESEEEFFVDKNDMVANGQDCVVIKSNLNLNPLILLSNITPFDKEIYTDDGLCLGTTKDVIIEGGMTRKIICDKGEILPKNIISIGKSCILVGKKRKVKKIAFSQQFTDLERKVTITQINKKPLPANDQQKPIKMIGNINTVLGKTVKENILGLNNEIIAKKGEKINKKMLNKALSHGKANLLLFLSE